MGLGWSGKVNGSELLINAVTIEEPKMLIGSPKREVTWRYGVRTYLANVTSPAERQDLTHLCHIRRTQ